MAKKYRARPIEIEAMRFTDNESANSISDWMEESGVETGFLSGCTDESQRVVSLNIDTPEDIKVAYIGDYIVKNTKGEFYPCKPDIFEAKYYIEGRQ